MQSHNNAPAAGAPTAALKRGPQQGPPEVLDRDIVKTGSMTITVADPSAAADKAADIAATAKGHVDSRAEDAGSGSGRAHTSIVLKVPAAKLDDVLRDLKGLGTVRSAETKADDVTTQRADLDARIAALQTSVDRLLAIMRDSKDTDTLLKAENELSKRQADLDSLRAQRGALGDQIAYSTINVVLLADTVGGPEPRQYQGFFGQVRHGWDALISTVTDLVMLFGLLLPWLVALAILAALGYGLVRVVNVRRK